MKQHLRCVVPIASLLAITGCSPDRKDDQRIGEMAGRFVEQQARQNEQNARQSQEIAAASRRLVEADAEARTKLLEAHAARQQELQAERASIDQQRHDLEQERSELALQRGRDPIIAETIRSIGTLLACLIPLLLAGWVVYVAVRRSSDAEAMADYLVDELTADGPQLLSIQAAGVPQIEAKAATPDAVDPAEDQPPTDMPF